MEWVHFLAAVNLIVLGVIEVLHLVFRTPYMAWRTTSVLYPMYGLTLYFYLHALLLKFVHVRKAVQVVVITLALLLGFNFISNASFRYVYEWKWNLDSYDKIESLMEDIKKGKQHAPGMKVYVSSSIGVCVNYYQFLYPERYSFDLMRYSGKSILPNHATLLELLERANYAIIIYPDDITALKAVKRKYTVVKDYPETNSMLIRFE